jgi:SAM-dependent methyltransferase
VIHAPNLEVRRHDVATDPLPENAFDLVHARVVLQHVPPRDQAQARLAAALKPGGWLVVEDFDSRRGMRSQPELDPAEARSRLMTSSVALWQPEGSISPTGVACRTACVRWAWWTSKPRAAASAGWAAAGRKRRAGRFGTTARADPRHGEIMEAEFDAELGLLHDPAFAFSSPSLWATCGRRPALT